MKKIIIKIFKLFFNYGDKKIKYLINNLLDDKILLLDIGAAGGINKRWEIISNNLSTSLVEPNIDNAKILETRGYNVIKNCFYKESNKELILYETRDKYCSSLLQPNKYYLNKGRLKVEQMGRGYAWLDTGTHDSLLEAAQFVHTLEKRQGMKISCIEEIAFRMGYIDKNQLEFLASKMKNNQYGQYLLKIADSN